MRHGHGLARQASLDARRSRLASLDGSVPDNAERKGSLDSLLRSLLDGGKHRSPADVPARRRPVRL
eukprot:13263690-Alexandrium_andersonii.AAC.1